MLVREQTFTQRWHVTVTHEIIELMRERLIAHGKSYKIDYTYRAVVDGYVAAFGMDGLSDYMYSQLERP